MSRLQQARAWLLEPTLVRRGVLSLLPAFVVVWVVLLTYIYVDTKLTIAREPGLQKFGDALTTALLPLDERAQLAAALASTETWVNIRRREIGRLPGLMLFELLDSEGKRIYASPALGTQILTSSGTPLTEVMIDGHIHRVYQHSTPRWSLRVAEPQRGDAQFLTYNGRLLVPYLLLAMPFVLLPVWLSVRYGLRPLQQLADRMAKRSANDLEPVGFEARHRELKPLVHALDTMLVKVRQKVAHERAFVQDAAHELRTPMAVITAQAHVMANADSAEERQQAQQQLDHAIARASHLAQQLLTLAALDNTQRPSPRSLDVAQWLRQALAQAAPGAMARQIELSLEAPDSFTRTLDVSALESIVQNLLDNAVRYGRSGGSVAVTLRDDRGGLCLTVQDDGPGIAPAEQARVFERFYRGTGHEVSGSGLGLAIVKQAAARMGGHVAMSAGLGNRGVGFRVFFP